VWFWPFETTCSEEKPTKMKEIIGTDLFQKTKKETLIPSGTCELNNRW